MGNKYYGTSDSRATPDLQKKDPVNVLDWQDPELRMAHQAEASPNQVQEILQLQLLTHTSGEFSR